MKTELRIVEVANGWIVEPRPDDFGREVSKEKTKVAVTPDGLKKIIDEWAKRKDGPRGQK